jgi:hypothetical protein
MSSTLSFAVVGRDEEDESLAGEHCVAHVRSIAVRPAHVSDWKFVWKFARHTCMRCARAHVHSIAVYAARARPEDLQGPRGLARGP